MSDLVPVDHDPFADATPASQNLTPVDHDPFAAPGDASKDPNVFQRIGSDWSNRMQNINALQQQENSGVVNPVAGEIGKIGQAGAMAYVDPLKEAGSSVLSGINSLDPTPGLRPGVKNAINATTGAVSKGINYLGNAGVPGLSPEYAKQAEQYYESSPNLKAVSEGVGNIAQAVPGFDATAALAGAGKELIGSAAGKVPQAIGSGISKMIPGVDPYTAGLADKAMTKFNIPLALHQVVGGESPSMSGYQKVSQDIPFSGSKQFYNTQFNAVNKAVANSFGQNATKITPPVIRKGYQDLGNKFNQMFSGRTIQLTPAQIDDIKSIPAAARGSLGNDAQSILQHHVDTILNNLDYANPVPGETSFDPYTGASHAAPAAVGASISGEKANQVRSQLQEVLRTEKDQAGEAADPHVAKALDSFMDATFSGLPPEMQEKYTNLKYQYKNLVAVTPAAGKAIRGNINPADLEGAVRRIYGDKAYSTGEAGDLGELAKISKTFLPKLGGSDTVQKGMLLSSVAGPMAGMFVAPQAVVPGLAVEGAGAGLNRLYQSGNTNQAAVRNYLKKYLPPVPETKADGGPVKGKIGFKLNKKKK